jgi:spermidine/putrescine transport system permease protein
MGPMIARMGNAIQHYGSLLSALYAVLVYIFLFLPIAVVVLMSFNSAKIGAFPLQSLTLRWYSELFRDRTIWEALNNSLIIAAGTTVLSVLLGILGAFSLVRYQFRLKSLFTGVLIVPLIVPGLIMGISLLSFYHFLSVQTSRLTVILGHAALALPYTTLVIAARLEGFDIRLEEAAASLGASPLSVFRKVTLPLIAPGVIAAVLFAWTISFDEFIITFFIIGGAKQTLPLKIWSLLKFGISPKINALSAVILSAALTLVTVSLKLLRRR